ncbi:MAG: hypothetical protein WEA77_09060 [Hyphomonas sp.]|uniref:GFA family protein n=1 Tax=Hyphomonas sp. TaxID=87 RepID=UPI0034A020C4
MTRVTGGCHSGQVRLEAEGDFPSGMECKCLHCNKKSFVIAFLGRQDFKLTKGEGACTSCGTQAVGPGAGLDGKEMAAINLRCVDGLDRSQITFIPNSGKDFSAWRN